MIPALHPQDLTVTVPTVGDPDDDGVPLETWAPAPWVGVNVQPESTSEERGGRQVVVERLACSGPLAPWITAACQIEWAGHTYEIEGRPAHYISGVLDHTELIAIRWEGT